MLGALGVWAALIDRTAARRGQQVRVTLQQGAALFWPHLWMYSARANSQFDAVPPRDVRHLIFRCRDGRYVQLVLGVTGAVAKLNRALGIGGDVDPEDRGVPDPHRGAADYFAHRGPIAEAIAPMTSEDVLSRLVAAGIPAGLVSSLDESLANPQADANDLVEFDDSGARWGAVPISLRPVQAGAAPSGRRGWSPDGTGQGPLTGLRVVDFGDWVSGPFATKLLADLGADVISVDPPRGLANLTGIRNSIVSNMGKRSIVCDLKSPTGLAVARRLADSADVVCHNFRPGVAERLGIGPDALRSQNPDLIYLHTTALGDRGAEASRGGFDMVAQALCGHETRAGGRGNEPLWTRSPFIDYATGALGAVGVLEALYARTVQGRGSDVVTSLLGTGLFLRSDCYVDGHGKAQGQVVLDAEQRGFSPAESLYATADGWIALVVRGTAMAQALADEIGFRCGDSEARWGDSEWSRIDAWAAQHSTEKVLGRLAELGVWATRCRRDALDDLGASRWPDGSPFVIEVDDQRFGRIGGVIGPQVHLSRYPYHFPKHRSAPDPGEHTSEVLTELGLVDHDRPTVPGESALDVVRQQEKVEYHLS